MVTAKDIKQAKEIERIKENIEVETIKRTPARLTEVVTQKSIAIELDDGKIITDLELLINIYNDLQSIKSNLGIK
jgi:hypothetical protein